MVSASLSYWPALVANVHGSPSRPCFVLGDVVQQKLVLVAAPLVDWSKMFQTVSRSVRMGSRMWTNAVYGSAASSSGTATRAVQLKCVDCGTEPAKVRVVVLVSFACSIALTCSRFVCHLSVCCSDSLSSFMWTHLLLLLLRRRVEPGSWGFADKQMHRLRQHNRRRAQIQAVAVTAGYKIENRGHCH